MRHDSLVTEQVETARLFCSPHNPRTNDQGVPHVADSIRRFGWQQPIVARRTGEVVAGNTRLKAAKLLGAESVPVVWFEGTDLEAIAFAIADNRTHEFSSWNESELARLLKELKAEDSLEGVGFDEADLGALVAKLAAEAPIPLIEDPGPEEPPANPITQVGDLWVLGQHRILCGDSTKPETYQRLLGNETVRLLSTDPPYCVSYTGKDRPVHNGKPSGKDWSNLYREVDISDLGEFLDKVFSAALPHVGPNVPIYCWHAHVQQPVIASVFEKHDLLLHQVIVWVKPSAVFGHSFFRWRHEPCAFGWRKGSKPEHGVAQHDTVWECDWEGKARVVGNEHPTQKPLRLFEIPMELHTDRDELVLEPFSGSGSQLVAAEKLGRRCRAIELQPAFVDVAIRRWQTATGKDAVLESTGVTYGERAAKRGVV